jgi:glycosyltransferase involved in cell wall biosynthesis
MKSISVCIASYNGELYIARQLKSILPQLSVDDELIISDDSSTDRTKKIVATFNDKRIKFIRNEGRKGPVTNFQNALLHARNEVIFLSDQDDVWLPTKVAEMLPFLEHYDLVISDCTVVNNELDELYPSFFAIRGSRAGLLHNIYKNSYIGCCMAFRKEVLSYALPVPSYVHMHDWWIGLLVEVKGKVFFYNKSLILYVRHGKNASPTGDKEAPINWVNRFYNRLFIVLPLVRRILK